eukprot:1179020-Prorocentrum_minimum.AAC.4
MHAPSASRLCECVRRATLVDVNVLEKAIGRLKRKTFTFKALKTCYLLRVRVREGRPVGIVPLTKRFNTSEGALSLARASHTHRPRQHKDYRGYRKLWKLRCRKEKGGACNHIKYGLPLGGQRTKALHIGEGSNA